MYCVITSTGEVSIGFQEMSLTVAEDELSIQVCVVIDAQQSVGDITIEFQLITQDDTATGKWYCAYKLSCAREISKPAA